MDFAEQHILERRRVLASADSPRAVDSADRTAGVTISPAVRHALCAGVWVDPGTVRDGRNGHARRCAAWRIHGGTRCVVAAAGDDCYRVGASFAAKGLKLRCGCAVVELGQTRGGFGDGSIALALEFLLFESLLLLRTLPQVTGFTASQQHSEARTTRRGAHSLVAKLSVLKRA